MSDANKFLITYNNLMKEEVDMKTANYVRRFSFTCSGTLPPLAAYFGGFISQ